MRLPLILLSAALSIAGCATTTAAPVSSIADVEIAQTEVRAAAAEFVSAFNGLDQVRFDSLWAEDATAFFPQPPLPIRRVEGKAEVLAWFKRFIDSRRAAGKPLTVDPKELRVQMLNSNSAIVSFHLGSDPNEVSRRTFIYRRESGGWRIVHLHASALSSEGS